MQHSKHIEGGESYVASAAPSAAPVAAPVAAPNSYAGWIYQNQSRFGRDNPLAWYGIRNVANNMVAITGLMATIVPTRMAMGYAAKWAHGKGYQSLSAVLSNNFAQNALGVGVSFSTFRTLYKMGQRGYDRVFVTPKSEEQTAQALQATPKNLWRDFWQIAPAEYPATMTAALALVGIRQGITRGAPELPQNYWKDIAGCALVAYPVFFELTEHMGRALQLQRGYNNEATNEHIHKDKQSVGEFLTRQLPAVATGIVPYIAFNNLAYRKTGRQLSFNAVQRAAGKTTIDGFWPAFWKERPYQFFWMYTLGRDLYMDAYDALTGRKPPSNKVEQVQGQGALIAAQPSRAAS